MNKKGSRKRPAAAVVSNAGFWKNDKDSLCLAGILVLALVVRLIAFADLSGTPYFSFILWDERIYHMWAKHIADGTFHSKSIYEFAPLFAYIVALLYKFFSPDLIYVRVLNIVLGVAVCWLVYLIGATMVNRRVGLWACLAAALYKPLILYSIVPLKETLAALCFAAVLYAFLILIENLSQIDMLPIKDGATPNKRLFIAAGSLGIAMGLLINVRPNALVMVPLVVALPIWYAVRDRLPTIRIGSVTVAMMTGLLLAVSPFVVRNYAVAGKLALSTTQSGFNLYLGNNLHNPDPYYRPVPFARSSPFEQGIQFTIEASRRAGHKMTPEEASRYWTAETFHEASRYPGAFCWKLWQKTLVVINRFEACDHYGIDFLGNPVKTFRLPFIGFWAIFPFAMVGMIQGIGMSRGIRSVSIVLAGYGLTLIAFFSSGRYRLPMVTLLIPLAASGIICIVEALRAKDFKKSAIYITSALFFLIMVNLPVRATDDQSAYFNTHAMIMDANGKVDEAIYYWNLSSNMNKPFSAFANVALADKEFQNGNLNRGYAYLNKIDDNSFASAQKYELIGDVLSAQQNYSQAAENYEKSLGINSAQREVLEKLIYLFREKDPARALMYEERLKYISSFYDLM